MVPSMSRPGPRHPGRRPKERQPFAVAIRRVSSSRCWQRRDSRIGREGNRSDLRFTPRSSPPDAGCRMDFSIGTGGGGPMTDVDAWNPQQVDHTGARVELPLI